MRSTRQTKAPKGRPIPAQGNALGKTPPKANNSPEAAKKPCSWPIMKSGELFSFVTSGSRGWAKYYSDSGAAFLRVGNLDHGSISLDLRDIQRVQPPSGTEGTRTRVQPGDILISITADVGMIGIVPEDFQEAYINQHVCLARPVSTVHAPYLAWCLSSPPGQQNFRELQRGATKVGLGLDDIRAVDVPLPPLPEQRRIVAEIEKQFTRLDAGVAALRRVQANLKRYRAAVLKAACEGNLVPTEAELHRKLRTQNSQFETGAQLLARILTERRRNWTGRGKYNEPAVPDTANLPALPQGWAWATVDQLAAPEINSITDGPFGSNLKTEHYTDSGPRVIRLQNIGDGIFVDEYAHISDEHFARLQKHRIHANDVVIAGLGESPPRSCVIPDFVGPAIVKADCIRFKPHTDFLSKFATSVLNCDPIRRRTKNIVHGVGRPRLNLGEIKSIVLPLPPVAEQTRIVAEVDRRLSVVEELEAVVSANLQRATQLRQSILQKAFTGNLLDYPAEPPHKPPTQTAPQTL